MLTLPQKRHLIRAFLDEGASYAELDDLCADDTTQNNISSNVLTSILEAIFLGTGKTPVFSEERVFFQESDCHVMSPLPKPMRFRECPVSSIPGHKKDRTIFESFYPILTDNPGLYFRVALAWLLLQGSEQPLRVPALLHLSNRDFDSMRRVKVYVPVITNMDTRMDIVAISSEAFLQMMLMRNDKEPCYYTYDPRKGIQRTDESVPERSFEQVSNIRDIQYPAFYESMLQYIQERKFSIGAYNCGQFILDLRMRF